MRNPQNLPLHIRLVELANAIVLDVIDVNADPVPNLTLAIDEAEAMLRGDVPPAPPEAPASSGEVESNVS
ncbi:MAG: hypothetical protein RLZZ171_1767 [Cyanobacteriota bacterium]|jgi:hypothetical protein